MSCIFCAIAEGKIPAKVIFRDNDIVAFHDVQPQSPTHILIIPKRHVSSLNDLSAGDAGLVGRLILTAKEMAERMGCAQPGYRLVLNCNRDGGQSVFHLHLHLLAGRPMRWPPG